MACDLKPTRDFIFGFLRCTLPKDAINVKLTVGQSKGSTHLERTILQHQPSAAPGAVRRKPFPSPKKKIEVFEEEKNEENSPFCPNLIKFTKKDARTKSSRERSHKRCKQRELDMRHFTPPKTKRPASLWAPLPASKTMATIIMARNTQIATTPPAPPM